MRSIEERLAASDPVARVYAHPEFDAMVARVIAAGRPRRDAAWRGFRLKVAAAAAATGLLTGAGVAALSTAGLSLPVLSFAAATRAPSASSAFSGALAMPLTRDWQFTGSDDLSSAPGSATVYALAAPSDPAATLTHAAAVLGVDVGTPTSGDAGRSFSASGSVYSGSIVVFDGYASWSISENDPPPGSSAPASGGQATSALEATALAWARQLTSLDLGTPTATPLGLDGAGATGPAQVSVPVTVDGRATDFEYDFTFAGDGSLVAADGVDLSLSAVGDYPLVSPAAGVAEISGQLYLAPAYAGWVAAGETPLGASSGAPSPSPGAGSTVPAGANGSTSTGAPPDTTGPGTPDTAPATVAPTVVDLTDVTTQYGAYSMADGSTLLLPVYVYAGDVVGQGWRATFRVVPVDPGYLDLSAVVSPRLY